MTTETPVEAVVIGAGVTGLCAAWHLDQALGTGSVAVLEAEDRPGGTCRTDLLEGYTLDTGPNGFLDKEPATLEWIERMGLTPRLRRANEHAARRFILKGNRLIEVKPPPGFLLSPLLSIGGRLRLLAEPFVPARAAGAPEESVRDFAARRIGPEAADTMVQPMVTGIYGGDARELSMEHCFPRLPALEREHGSLFKALKAARRENSGASAMGPRGTLTTLTGGIGELPDHVAARLGGAMRYGVRVEGIEAVADSYHVRTDQGIFETPRVVVATPAYVAGELVAGLDAGAAEALRAIPYAPIAVVCMGWALEHVAHPLDGFGFLVAPGGGKRTLGCIWTSSLFPGQAPDGHVLFRAMLGGARDPDVLGQSDGELCALVRKELCDVLPMTGEPTLERVYRWERGIPQYVLGHGARLAAVQALEEANPGLAVAGNAYRGIGLNECVLSAQRAVDRVVVDERGRR